MMKCKYCNEKLKDGRLAVYTDTYGNSGVMVYYVEHDKQTWKDGWAHMQCALNQGSKAIRVVEDRSVLKFKIEKLGSTIPAPPPVEIDLDFDWGGAKQW